MSVSYKVYKVDIDGFEHYCTVIEYQNKPYTDYWVKIGGFINAVTKNGEIYGNYYGIGANKYREMIKEAIQEFMQEKESGVFTETDPYRQMEVKSVVDLIQLEGKKKEIVSQVQDKALNNKKVQIDYWLDMLRKGNSKDKKKAYRRLIELSGGKVVNSKGKKMGKFRENK